MKYSREEMKNIDLDKIGLLYGLNGELYDFAKSYMETIDYDRIKMDNTIQCIAPAIRNILSKILDSEKQFLCFKRDTIIKTYVLGLINVNDIIDGLDTLYSELLPISDKYLPNIDNQAELTVLFCSNYIHTLIKKVNETKPINI